MGEAWLRDELCSKTMHYARCYDLHIMLILTNMLKPSDKQVFPGQAVWLLSYTTNTCKYLVDWE